MPGWIYDQIEGGSRQDFGRSSSGVTWRRAPVIHLLHTTEGSGWPGYVNGGNAPHFTINPRLRQTRQHFSLDAGSRALRPGGVDANAMGTVQYEMIMSAKDSQDMTDDEIAYVASVLSVVTKETGIKAQCSVTFGGGEAYGINGPYRLSVGDFLAYEGILGHQHVPGNSHWDPGHFPIDRLISAMGNSEISHPITPTHTPAPSRPTATSSKLAVDGIWGVLTTKAEQRALGVTADGIRGPRTIAAEQRRTGARVDGLDGPDTRKHLQAHLRVRQDGIVGPITVRALQSRLNAGTF